MKRRGFLFVGLLVIALLAVYLQPVYFPKKPAKPRETIAEDTTVDGTSTALKYEPIKAQGYAAYIGKSLDSLTARLGKPVKSYDSGFGFFVNVYRTAKEKEYLEVNVTDKKVRAIKVIGQDADDLAPFKMKMSMNELTNITMLYPSFSIDYNEQTINFELMEEDMNYRPLIAFDNGTFAILFFNQNNSQLFGAMFLDKDMLLKLSPYQVADGKVPQFEETSADWEQVNRSKEEQAFIITNALRSQDKLENYQTNFTLQGKADDLQVNFLEKPDKYLDESRRETYRRMHDGVSNQPFLITSDEFDNLLKIQKFTGLQGFMEEPCYDLMFQLLTYYSDPYIHTKFMDESPQAIGIAISKRNMVVLLEKIEKTEDSE